MKKKPIALILLTAFLLSTVVSCGGPSAGDHSVSAQAEPSPAATVEAVPDSIELVTPVPTEAITPEPVPTPAPTEAPTPTPEPTATPEPTPSALGILDIRHADRFSDVVIDTDDTYRDESKSICIERHETKDVTGASLVYYVIDVYVQDVESIRRGLNADEYKNASTLSIDKMAKACNAIFAISGDNCTHRYDAYVVINGEFAFKSKKFTRDLCVLFRDGEMRTYAPSEISAAYLEERGVWQTWNFGPMLLDENGEPMTKFNMPDRIGDRNPRAAIGYYEPGHYCFVLCDGRQRGYSMGLSLEELAALMKELGCVCAYNLDGGISAQIAWHGKRINQPDKNRSIMDIIYIPYPTE